MGLGHSTSHDLFQEFNDVAYDYKGKRSAVFLRYVNGDVEAKLKIVVRYDDNEVSAESYIDVLISSL